MDAPFTDRRMESMWLIFLDPGMRRDDNRINQSFLVFYTIQNWSSGYERHRFY